jgi:repressor LexA
MRSACAPSRASTDSSPGSPSAASSSGCRTAPARSRWSSCRSRARSRTAAPPSIAPAPAAGFSPKVIRGDFAAALPGATVANDTEAVELPLYGRIAAGTPIEALRDNSRTVGIPASMLGRGEHYALEIAGDSMVDAGILDGDTVVIQCCDSADNGSIVVALVDGQEATLKRLRRRGDSIALEPANKAYETRIFGPDRVKVQGRLVGLIRQY